MQGFVLLFAWTVLVSAYTLDRNNDEESNDRPIIAILAEREDTDIHKSYIAASYVKYLESSGARVVPIPTNLSPISLMGIFSSVNGVLFPGGSVDVSSSLYGRNAGIFYGLALQANMKGDYFPIWGTCLGFQMLHYLAGQGNISVITPHNSEDIAMSLNFTEKARGSRMFKNMPEELFKILANEDVTYNHHADGISLKTYTEVKSLDSFFNILSTNVDKDGKTFVSTVEGNHSFFRKPVLFGV